MNGDLIGKISGGVVIAGFDGVLHFAWGISHITVESTSGEGSWLTPRVLEVAHIALVYCDVLCLIRLGRSSFECAVHVDVERYVHVHIIVM